MAHTTTSLSRVRVRRVSLDQKYRYSNDGDVYLPQAEDKLDGDVSLPRWHPSGALIHISTAGGRERHRRCRRCDAMGGGDACWARAVWLEQ
eukprot:scaffold101523_cov63-Phaeocystis_antarctica.AAC.1